jgi:putative transposase
MQSWDLQVSTLIKRVALEALSRRGDTSKLAPRDQDLTSLLRKLTVTRSNEGGHGMDCAFIPAASSAPYMGAVKLVLPQAPQQIFW